MFPSLLTRRNRGGREGSMAAMRKLHEDGFGKLIMRKSKGSIRVSRGGLPLLLRIGDLVVL